MFEHIKTVFGIGERKSLGIDQMAALMLGNGVATVAGIAVGPESALRCSASFGAIKVIAETICQLPVKLYRRVGDDREQATDHPAFKLVAKAANPWTPAAEFRLILGTHLATFGNAYAYIGCDAAEAVQELIPLDPRHVTVKQDPTTLEPVYLVSQASGEQREYSRAEILHIRTLGLDVHKGASPVTLAREAIGLSLTLESHCAGLFGRGAKPSGILKHAKQVGDDVMKRLRSSFENFFSGGQNSGKTLILEDGMTFEPLQLNSVDSQTLEMRRFQIEEISRFWRVPLHLLNELDRATHNNAESMGQQFLTYCILPLLKLWQDSLAISLLTPEEQDSMYFEFLVDDLARADIAARFAAYSQAINAGIYNPNEIRGLENKAGYPGGETYMRPLNTAVAPVAGAADGGNHA